MLLGKYSFGIGDRFGQQGEAQLRALMSISKAIGVDIVPVWNKSNREHDILGTEPSDVRHEAEQAVAALEYKGQWFTDADHINMLNVDRFLDHSDFFTIDIADYIGQKVSDEEIEAFVERNMELARDLTIPHVDSIDNPDALLRHIASEYLYAIREAGRIYRHIEKHRGRDNFVAEVSMDEASTVQSPVELVFLLREMMLEGILVQNIAPKFVGHFYKGIEYVGDPVNFERQLDGFINVINYAVSNFNLPSNLKVSVHSGSDKFALYPVIGRLIRKYNVGIHVKTAGTTWLEEVTALAVSGDEDALKFAKYTYIESYSRCEEFCKPYSTVVEINREKLPHPVDVEKWSGEQFASALRNVPTNPDYNVNLRQLIHIGYKAAAERMDDYLAAIRRNKDVTGQHVENNISERHLRPLFVNR